MPLTDEKLADAVTRSSLWKRRIGRLNPKSNAQRNELVFHCLKEFRWIPPYEFNDYYERISAIIRSRVAKKAAETRKKNARKARVKKELARQGDFFK